MDHNEVERFDVDGLTVRILTDPEPMNPRKEFDHMGTMVCFHRRYDLGDKHMSVEEAKEFVERIKGEGAAVLSLYLYDHSGITMQTSPFSCPWDSGQVGFIYMERKAILNNWGVKRITKKLFMQAIELMEGEVKEYDTYLTGEVYGYVVEDPDGNHLDSCWGYFGDIKYVREEGTSAAKYAAQSLIMAKQQAAVERQRQEDIYAYADWQYDVSNGDTKLGYKEWVDHNIESHKNDPKEEADAEGN